jgi:predicted phosphodiesterase
MKICIVSDSHDRADPLAGAVHAAKALGAEAVIHCGDLIGAQTIKPALAAGLPVHAIHGNNLGDTQAMHFQSRLSGGLLQYHGAEARLELAGRRIIVTHYDHLGYALACTGDWDLVCCGHSPRGDTARGRREGRLHVAGQPRHGGGHLRPGHLGPGRPRANAIRGPYDPFIAALLDSLHLPSIALHN